MLVVHPTEEYSSLANQAWGEEGSALLGQCAVCLHDMFWEQGGTTDCPSARISLEHLIQASLEVPHSCQLKVPE